MRRIATVISIIMVLMVSVEAQVQSEFGMDVEFGWEYCYRPTQWTPVGVTIFSPLTKPFEGTVTVEAQQDSLNVMIIRQDFVLTPDLPTYIPLVTKLAFAPEECRIRITDNKDRTILRDDRSLWDPISAQQTLVAVQENELLIGVIGSRKFSLGQLSRYSRCKIDSAQAFNQRRSSGSNGKVYVKHKLERTACWDWTGFAGLDLLLLYDPDWNLFNPTQMQAISEWVNNGGKLLLVLGSHLMPAGGAIAELLPFELAPAQQVSITPEAMKEEWNWSQPAPETVVCRPLTPKLTSRIHRTFFYETDKFLFATGYAGFGRVGVLAFDPALIGQEDPQSRAQFWVKHIAAVLEDSSKPLNRSIKSSEFTEDEILTGSSYNTYVLGQADSDLTAVLDELTNIPELKPLSIWWVILLLTLLALLLGPVDYYILKRRDHLPWTWLTCTGWIILFSVGAYYGVQALRGGRMRVLTVSVWDGIQGGSSCWSTTYSGFFAPKSDEYYLDLKEPTGKQWWSGISPSGNSLYAYEQRANRRISYSQSDGENRPISLPINIWSMQTMLTEAPQPRLPLSATVQLRGSEVTLRLTNYSNSAIKQGYILFDGDQVLQFGAVSAGETKEISGTLRTEDVWDLSVRYASVGYASARYYNDYPSSNLGVQSAYFAHGCWQRTQIIQEYLRHGAAVVCVEFDNADAPFDVEGENCRYDHIQWVRQVIFPQER
ncbi:hypothetical protein ACFL02_09340 [Planctomycetota bacterium]